MSRKSGLEPWLKLKQFKPIPLGLQFKTKKKKTILKKKIEKT